MLKSLAGNAVEWKLFKIAVGIAKKKVKIRDFLFWAYNENFKYLHFIDLIKECMVFILKDVRIFLSNCRIKFIHFMVFRIKQIRQKFSNYIKIGSGLNTSEHYRYRWFVWK